MRAAKVLTIILLTVLVAVLFVGCAQSFTYTHYVDTDGGVHFDFLLIYDQTSADAEIVKEQTVTAMRTYAEENGFNEYASISTEVDGEVSLSLTFPSVTDYYIVLGRTGREENEPNVPTEVGFINRYDSVEDEGYLTENNIEYVRSLTDAVYRDFPLECDFYYTYGTTSRLTRSNGEVQLRDGVYYHTWKLTYGEPQDIRISTYSVNGVILMVVIISVFVLSLAVIFVIIYITDRKKRPRVSESGAGGSEGGDNARTE